MPRRGFLKTAAGLALAGGAVGAAGLVGAGTRSAAGATTGPAAGPMIRKAVKYGMVGEKISMLEKFKLLKELGFDGVELDSPNVYDPAEVLAARDESGLPIHGVVCSTHWDQPLSHPDPDVRRKGLDGATQALRDAKRYGGTSVLLVPAVVNKQIAYDEAYSRSQAEIRKLLPLAEELGVPIAIENVWNEFLLSPLEAARYIDEFESPLVRAYFDVGNVVRSGWPEQWIRILGRRILKLDIKEFSRKKRDQQGLWKGFEVELLEGDCDWPAVMKALREIGYTGWATAEIPGGDRQRLKDIARRMDRIFETAPR